MKKKKLKGYPGWTYREILNPTTGERKNRYFFKQKPAKRIVLTSRLSQQLAGYVLIEKDLRNILEWLSKINDLIPKDQAPTKGKQFTIATDKELYSVIKALFVALVSFYGKCFTSCEGRRVKLEKIWVDEKFQEEHETLIGYRHNFTAHSGADKFEEVKIAAVLDPKERRGMLPILVKELKQPSSLLMSYPDEEDSFKKLVMSLQSKVRTKILTLEKKIITDDIIAKGKEYWY